jgi:hypothetical protein
MARGEQAVAQVGAEKAGAAGDHDPQIIAG